MVRGTHPTELSRLKWVAAIYSFFKDRYGRQALHADRYLMSHIRIRLFILTLALALSPAVLGEVYKWIDAEGQVHYSDHPPPGVKNAEVFDTAPAVPTQPDSSAEELGRIRKLTKELETDRKAREAERAALEEQRRRESLANQYKEQEAPLKREPDVELYYPYPDSYGCCPLSPERCDPRHSSACCGLYPWTCGTIQPPPLSPAPPSPRPPWRPESPQRPTPPRRPTPPPQRPVHPPLDQGPPAPDLKQPPSIKGLGDG